MDGLIFDNPNKTIGEYKKDEIKHFTKIESIYIKVEVLIDKIDKEINWLNNINFDNDADISHHAEALVEQSKRIEELEKDNKVDSLHFPNSPKSCILSVVFFIHSPLSFFLIVNKTLRVCRYNHNHREKYLQDNLYRHY